MTKIGGFIMALVDVGCFCSSLHCLGKEVLLDATGHSTTGEVTDKFTTTDENNNISYYLNYSYNDSDEHSYASNSDVFKSMYESHTEGSPIPVVYSSTYPSISRIRSAGEYLWPTIMFAAIGCLPIWFGLRMILTEKME